MKRDEIKYIRDKAKSAYEKGEECEICGTVHNLDFHHYYSLTPLYNRWKLKNSISIKTEEDVLAIRDRFIKDHHAELYEHAVTICHDHHMKLHAIYGRNPNLGTAPKQMRWVKKQREKHAR